jgi:endonuclease YncB( thermonuclease family)
MGVCQSDEDINEHINSIKASTLSVVTDTRFLDNILDKIRTMSIEPVLDKNCPTDRFKEYMEFVSPVYTDDMINRSIDTIRLMDEELTKIKDKIENSVSIIDILRNESELRKKEKARLEKIYQVYIYKIDTAYRKQIVDLINMMRTKSVSPDKIIVPSSPFKVSSGPFPPKSSSLEQIIHIPKNPSISDVLDICDLLIKGHVIDATLSVPNYKFCISEWSVGWIKPIKIYDGDTITNADVVFPAKHALVGSESTNMHIKIEKLRMSLLETDLFDLTKDMPLLRIKSSIRMYGYDSPEMRQSTSIPDEQRQQNKESAMNAKKAFENQLVGADYYICIFVKDVLDKYGRLLTVMYTPNGQNINRFMLNSGYGKEYSGGTKL